MKRPAILFLSALLLSGLVSCGRKSSSPEGQKEYKDLGGFTVDSEVPGSEVFFEGQKLGTVPVTLSSNDLVHLSIRNPQHEPLLPLTPDPKGVAVFRDNTNGLLERVDLMFLAPANVRSDYVSFETPWGTRTKPVGFSSDKSSRKFMSVRFKSVFGDLIEKSLSLKMEVMDMSATNGPWKLKAVLTNHSDQVITGFKPSIQVSQSKKLGENGRQSGKRDVIELPEAWASINPGQSLETELQISPDTESGDYEFGMSFQIFKDKTCNTMSGWGYVPAPERQSFLVK